MKSEKQSRTQGLILSLIVCASILDGCSVNPSPREEEAIARIYATSQFKKTTGCSDAKVNGISVETHLHPRWIGRESLRIYKFEMEGCNSRIVERVVCSEESGCSA